MTDVWLSTLQTVLFIFAIWAIGDFSKEFFLSPIIAEILVGIIFGPHVLNIVPFTDVSEASLFSVLGTLGVTLLIMHSGLHVNVTKIKSLGWSAALIGVIGTILPTTLGMFIFWAYGYDLYPEAFIGGISITPASVGVAMRVLLSMRKLNTIYGQAILAAAYIDDFLSLMLFIFITNITLREPSFVNTGLPIIGAFVFVGISIASALTFMPVFINGILDCLAKKCKNFRNRDKAHMIALFVFLIGYSVIGHYIGSHLLGAFLAGFTFSKVRRSMILWRIDVKLMMSWLLRFFFSATVAFNVPVDILLTFDSWWKGMVISVLCVVTKLASTCHMKEYRWIIGWAIVSRGEFAFLIAEFAFQENVIDKKQYSIIVWALITSTMFAPIILQRLIKKRDDVNKVKCPDKAYQMILEGHHHEGILFEIYDAISTLGYEVMDTVINTDGKTDKDIITIHPPDDRELTEEDIEELKEEMIGLVSDPHLKIIFRSFQILRNGAVDIDIMGSNLGKIKECVIKSLEEHNLSILQTDDISEEGVEEWHIKTIGRTVSLEEETDISKIITEQIHKIDDDVQVVVRLVQSDSMV